MYPLVHSIDAFMKYVSFVFFAIAFSGLSLYAQEKEVEKVKTVIHNRTFVKINLYGIVLRNYSLQLEHTLGKRVSIGIGYRSMPNGKLPLQQEVTDFVGSSSAETNQTIDQLQVGNSAITPEIRFYVGKKGYGHGFYFAPFYRYATFDASNISIDYTNVSNTQSSLNISGKVRSGAFGLLLGAQWKLGKHLSLDWWIIGPHYGRATGTLQGVPSIPLTVEEQQSLRAEMEKIEVPFTDRSVDVTASRARYILDGPWGGVRTGLALGFHF